MSTAGAIMQITVADGLICAAAVSDPVRWSVDEVWGIVRGGPGGTGIMTRSVFQSLTEAQREAVEHVEGPLLILAGPGSGKTRVVTHRIAHLIEQGIPAREILALTFTNKAADEMQRRVAQLAPGASVWISTFHRFCSRLLRRYADHVGLDPNFTIYDSSDSLRALKHAIEGLDVQLTMTTPERLAHQISWAKNHLMTADEYRRRPGTRWGRSCVMSIRLTRDS